MPIFEYICQDCGEKFEDLVIGSSDDPVPCPMCKSDRTLKLISLISAKGIASGCATCVPSKCPSSKFT